MNSGKVDCWDMAPYSLVQGTLSSRYKRHETVKGEKDWEYRRTNTRQCHCEVSVHQEQKQNSEKLHLMHCYLLMGKRAVSIFRITPLGLLDGEDGCSTLLRNAGSFPARTAEHPSRTGLSPKHRSQITKPTKNTCWEKKSVNICQTTRRQTRENSNLLILMANVWVKKLRKISIQCELSRSN